MKDHTGRYSPPQALTASWASTARILRVDQPTGPAGTRDNGNQIRPAAMGAQVGDVAAPALGLRAAVKSQPIRSGTARHGRISDGEPTTKPDRNSPAATQVGVDTHTRQACRSPVSRKWAGSRRIRRYRLTRRAPRLARAPALAIKNLVVDVWSAHKIIWTGLSVRRCAGRGHGRG